MDAQQKDKQQPTPRSIMQSTQIIRSLGFGVTLKSLRRGESRVNILIVWIRIKCPTLRRHTLSAIAE